MDSRQERIWRRLLLLGPGPAAFFRDAGRLMSSQCDLASKRHLVGHLLREIESALRDVLEPFVDTSCTQGSAQQKKRTEDEHGREIRFVLAALGIPQDDPVAVAWLRLAGQGSPTALHREAHRDNLDFRRADAEFEKWWDDVQSVFDVVLSRFEENYAAVFRVLDELLASSSADIDTLRIRVPNNYTAHEYFFSRLDSPAWIAPLVEGGMLGHPPDPEVVDDGTGVRFPGWPVVHYLERMATNHAASYQDVIAAVLAIPETANVRVHHGLLRVALNLPPDLSKKLVSRAVRWMDGPYRPLTGIEYAKLIRHLAAGGAESEALELAATLFTVSADVNSPGSDVAPLHVSLWEYKESLQLALPSLAEAAPLQTLEFVSGLLEKAIEVGERARGAGREADGGVDLSHFWRPAIEDHNQNRDRDNLPGLLVKAARDAALVAASRWPESVPELVAALEGRSRQVFRRIAIHLLRIRSKDARDLVRRYLLDRTLFDNHGVLHEYYHLLHDCFGLLWPEDQAVILGWIDEGPDRDECIARFEEEQGSLPSDDQVSDYCDRWRLRKLMPIAEFLAGEWKRRFDGLVARWGLPEHPDFLVYHGTWIGPTSPLTLEVVRAMDPAKLVAYVRGWVPPKEWDAPTPEGLARLVTAAVAEEPTRYASVLQSLVGLEATYVRGFFDGLRQAVENKRSFEWEPVLKLAVQVVNSPWPTPDPSGPVHDRDSDWVSTRKTIAAVIEAGLASGASEMPISFREDVWKILESLAEDSNPTPEDESRYGDGGFDAVTMSINTVRGSAMHAIIQYGLWVMRHVPGARNRDGEPPPDAAAVPEMWPVLERHLDVSQDPSLAVRSVYGQWFPWIHLLGPDWAVSHVGEIFPPDPQDAPWWTAAWIGYVMHTRPFDDVLPVLRPVYEHAVKLLEPDEKPLIFGGRPSERLGEHLVTYAWRGKIALDPVDPLLEEYWAKADVNVRRQVLGHVGRSLRDWLPAALDPGIPPAIERLKLFWAFVVSRAGRPDHDSEGNELSAFTWWFASGQFDDDWAFDELELVLQKTSLLDGAHLLVERLVETVEREPLRSVRALDKLVQSDREGWRIRGWKGEARQVLEKAMKSGDSQTRRACVALANRLVAKGHLEFRALVDSNDASRGGEETQ
jgi:hypothetical protein